MPLGETYVPATRSSSSRPAPRPSLRDAAIRAAYLEAYRSSGFHRLAAIAVGVTANAAASYRAVAPEFRLVCAAIDAARNGPLPRAPYQRWTRAKSEVFLAAVAASGNVAEAARRAGLTVPNVYKRRRENADFAADWAVARNQALDRVEDKLFAGVFGGFKRIETLGKVIRTIVTQRPDAMFRLLATRRSADRSGVRTIDITPAMLLSARNKLERQLHLAATTGSVDGGLAALPAPTVTAS